MALPQLFIGTSSTIFPIATNNNICIDNVHLIYFQNSAQSSTFSIWRGPGKIVSLVLPPLRIEQWRPLCKILSGVEEQATYNPRSAHLREE